MFEKATKTQSKLRLAIYGPAGSGKTYTMLRIGAGIVQKVGGRMAVVDSEAGRASKYSGQFDFDRWELKEKSIQFYLEALEAAAGKYTVIGVDSMSHAWQALLEEVDRLKTTRFSGNKWAAWSEGSPKHKKLIDTIIEFPGHIIATMRAKTEWLVEEDDRGKKQPKRVGLAPEQRADFEYEFDVLMMLDPSHTGHIIKDATGGTLQDRFIEKPGEALGVELVEWLSSGAPPPTPVDRVKTLLAGSGHTEEELIASMKGRGAVSADVSALDAVPSDILDRVIKGWKNVVWS